MVVLFKPLLISSLMLFALCLVACKSTNLAPKDTEPFMDTLENSAKYEALHPGFARVFAFLKATPPESLAVGRYEIDGSKLFCTVTHGPGRSRVDAPLEAHRKYIDIQYVISGTEEMGWKPVADCREISQTFDEERDIMFFKDVPKRWVTVPAGSFVIFYPKDGHAPLVSDGILHKAVFKIAVQ